MAKLYVGLDVDIQRTNGTFLSLVQLTVRLSPLLFSNLFCLFL